MRCFLINLDRSPDRLAAMCDQLAQLPIPWERIPAVDGAALALPNPSLVDEKAFNRRHHALLRRGEIGCYLSHHAALTRFLASDSELGLILEDDVELGPDVPSVLAALSACPDRWDLVKLHATHPGGVITRLRLDGRHHLVSLTFRHGSAAAYVVNRNAARRLADGLLPMTVPYDHEFDRAWKYGLRLRAVLPLPVTRRPVRSTIVTTRPVDVTARTVNARGHKPWYAQGGMVLFRGANDILRVFHELRQA
jgi:glycosyl transferase family 25